jgi:hypothetical protein
MANAVQHIEAGGCSGCRDPELARKQIYKLAQTQLRMLGDRAPVVQLDRYGAERVPDYPYACGSCGKASAPPREFGPWTSDQGLGGRQCTIRFFYTSVPRAGFLGSHASREHRRLRTLRR